uniref:SERPIN domain-containing protein n=1 Tax=Strongyloides papillosus TaxID=174720 RepID=A0A0N5CGN3_STREA
MVDSSNLIVESQANFAIKSLTKLSQGNESLVFSPFSLTLALTLCFLGSKGKTNTEIKNFLFPKIDENEFIEYLEDTIENVEEFSESYTTVRVANKIYLKKDLKANEDYLKKIDKYFKASAENVDFTNPNLSSTIINDYISNSTKTRIKNFISSKDILPKIDSIIGSAILFQSSWEERFKKKFTKNSAFFKDLEQNVFVSLMHKQSYLPYSEDGDFHFLQLPYSDEDFSFAILLPKVKSKLKSLLKKVTGKKFLSLLRKTDTAQVLLDIPKFKLENSENYVKLLQSIGLKNSFNSKGDFSLISPNMKVIEIRQKSKIGIGERGTEVTKDTSIKMLPSSDFFHSATKKVTIRADHPFLFFILFKEQILFNGIYQ